MTHADSHPHADPYGVAVGREVYTADGEHLGTVKEVAGGFFKVDVRMKPDFWLQSQFVSRAAEDRITMDFTREALDDYKLSCAPEVTTPDPDVVAGAAHEPSMPEITAASTIQAAARGERLD